MSPQDLTIGIIGGSGLYELPGLTDIKRHRVETPFGPPSDELVEGRLHDKRMVFLPRHGQGHRLLPHELNYRANIWALKKVGVSQLLSISAVGSMKESIPPGTLVFVDQFIDLTRRRISTFLGEGVVAHVALADPVDPGVHDLLGAAAETLGFAHQKTGIYVCVEGPQFSTRAESRIYRSWGVDVIGMTNMPEAKLAREAEIGYATVALATDYDCWHETEEEVSVEAVLAVLAQNVDKARSLIAEYVRRASPKTQSELSRTALRKGLLAPIGTISAEVRARLAPLLDPIAAASPG